MGSGPGAVKLVFCLGWGLEWGFEPPTREAGSADVDRLFFLCRRLPLLRELLAFNVPNRASAVRAQSHSGRVFLATAGLGSFGSEGVRMLFPGSRDFDYRRCWC